MVRTIERALLALILLVYAALATLYAVKTPPWQIPDEPAHYNYIRQVAAGGCCPEITPGDWDAAYLEDLKASGFDPALLGNLPGVQYEDHQPPLYYLLAAPLYAATGGNLIALRLFSALLGAGAILCVYGIGRAAAGSALLALSAAAFAAFVPQHVAILAGVSNDALAELIVGAGVWLAMRYVVLAPDLPQRTSFPDKGARAISPLRLRVGEQGVGFGMGLVIGLGLLTKASTWLLALLIPLAVWLRWRREGRPLPDLLRAWARVLIPALILGALWWLRNLGVYGWPDFMGLGAHDRVVVGQLRTAEMIAQEGVGAWLGTGLRVTFQSFWGQFGWMGVPMPLWVYLALLAFTGVAYAGLILRAVQARRKAAPTAVSRDALILLAALFGLGIAQFLYYNTAFVQFQGRYLYPAMAAFALAYAAGIDAWVGLAAARWPGLRWLTLALMFGLAGLSGYALWRFVIPNLRAW